VERVVQKGCGIVVLGDIQNPTGHDPGQPALADPDLSSGVGLDNLQRSSNLIHSVII